MKCYFHGSGPKDTPEEKLGVISFAIPDIGVLYRSTWKGDLYECQYISLLSLVKFIEANPDIFSQTKVQLFGDSPLIIQQINRQAYTPESLEVYRDLSLLYIRKFQFSLRWIPKQENRATSNVVDMPPNPSLKRFKFKEPPNLSRQSRLPGGFKPPGIR